MKVNPNDLIDINQRLGLPRTYRFNPELRWMTILLSLLLVVGAGWFIIFRISMATNLFVRMLPFLVIFFSISSILNNVTALDSIRFEPDRVIFRTLLKRPVKIAWADFRKMEFSKRGMKAIKITYETPKGSAQYLMTLTFSNILEIVNSMAELCPQLEYDHFLQNVIVGQVAQTIERREHADS